MPRRITLRDRSWDIPEQGDGTALPDQEETPATPYRSEINLFELARLLVTRRKWLIGSTLAVMIVTAVALFLQPNLYTSTATILPSGKSNNMSALKNLVGLGGGFTTADENSSALFPVVLNSNLVVDAVAQGQYTFAHNSESMTMSLADYFGIDNRDRLRRAVKNITSVRSDRQTGEIYVGVETKYAELSRAVLNNYLTQLEDFNLNKRRSAARDNERYLARQLMAAKEELQMAEDNLEAFQKSNLDWASTGSPEILKDLGRLQREVDARSAAYAMLTREYEMAKLEAKKDVPVVRLLDAPSLPVLKSGPFRRNIILFSGVISFALAAFGVIIWHLVTQMKGGANRDDFDAFRRSLQDTFPRVTGAMKRIKSSITDRLPLARS